MSEPHCPHQTSLPDELVVTVDPVQMTRELHHKQFPGFVGVVTDVSTERRLQRDLNRYRLLVENTRDIVLFVSGSGVIIDANQAALSNYRYPRNVLIGMNVSQLLAPGSPHSITNFLKGADDRARVYESEHVRADGSTFDVEVSTVGAVVGGERVLLNIVRDISQRKRSEAMEAVWHEIDHRILDNRPLSETLDYACSHIAEIYRAALVWIGLPETDGTISVAASAGPNSRSLEVLQVRWDDTPFGQGPAGRAIRTGEVQSGDFEADPGATAWRPQLEASAVRSYLTMPLVTEDRVLGILSLSSTDPEVFGEPVRSYLANLARQLAMSLINAQRQELIHLQTAALESAANAVMIADRQGCITWANSAFTALTGYRADEIPGSHMDVLLTQPHRERLREYLENSLVTGESWHGEVQARRKDGSEYVEEQTITPVRRSTGEISHFIAVKQDITERRQQQERIHYLATHDFLTDLPNRRALEYELQHAYNEGRTGRHGALVLIDVDDFKLVNDSAGHFDGDRLLVALSKVLTDNLRAGDFLARLGGDEFAVVLSYTAIQQAEAIADRLQQAVKNFHHYANGYCFEPTVSMGMVGIDGTLEPKFLLTLADGALYSAKEHGKDHIVSYNPSQDHPFENMAFSRAATEVKQALANDRFILCFQPVVNIKTGCIEYYEVLTRMVASDGSVMQPASFFPAARRFRLEPQIDVWVLHHVAEVLKEHKNLKLLVNLAGTTLSDRSTLEYIESCMLSHGDCAARVSFEINESSLVSDLDDVRRWMTRMHKLGTRFLLDDFGSGFSSFVYLQNLPVDIIKIDGSFIQNLDTNRANQAMVQAMKMVARALDKQVIAEWVETPAVAATLQDLGIEYGQGYLFGRPCPQVFGDGCEGLHSLQCSGGR